MPTAELKKGDVKDIKLADAGKRKIEWAGNQMPVLESIRKRFVKEQPLKGLRCSACLHVTSETANLMITPNLDSGNITYNMLKMTGSNGIAMGPVLLGAARPVHILTNSATVRRIVNMTALAVVEANKRA